MSSSEDSDNPRQTASIEDVPRNVLAHVVDVHCHPTDTDISSSDIEELPIRICAMATRKSDQALVAQLAHTHPDKVIPCFGYHPWFSHLISLEPIPETPEAKSEHYRSLFLSSKESRTDRLEAFEHVVPALPHPFPLSSILDDLRHNLTHFANLHKADPSSRPKPMLGEVGLDRSFRIPFAAYDPSLPEPLEAEGSDTTRPRLTPFHVPVEHQLAILEAQIGLAVELGLNVSLHSVKSQAQTLQLFARLHDKHGERFDAISVDMHSCGVSVETWLSIEKYPNIYLSLSTGINGRSPLHRELIKACSPERMLVESDIHEMKQCAGRSWAMLNIVAEVKGWSIEKEWSEMQEDDPQKEGVVRRLEANWETFVKGGHKRLPPKPSRKKNKKVSPE